MRPAQRSWTFGLASGRREVCDAIDPSLLEKLPTLGSSCEPMGELVPTLRERWKLPAGVVVSAGGGDNMMGAIGTANVLAGFASRPASARREQSSPTAQKPAVDPKGEVAAFCDSTDAWLPLVCTMNVTVATEAARNLFGWSHAQVEAEIANVAPGSDGLLFLPYLTGERTPNLPRATGVFHVPDAADDAACAPAARDDGRRDARAGLRAGRVARALASRRLKCG